MKRLRIDEVSLDLGAELDTAHARDLVAHAMELATARLDREVRLKELSIELTTSAVTAHELANRIVDAIARQGTT